MDAAISIAHELIAAIDLGSNSFRLQVGRVINQQIYTLDGLKESVRLAAGLDERRCLTPEAEERALAALQRFGERLAGFAPANVRAVATNALRVARNSADFLPKAEAALGFPIEIIAGREEARLIYLGVAHTLSEPARQHLVIDIGGGSTEFIIGRQFSALKLESLRLGCVSHTLRYFPEGRITRKAFREAELAAGKMLQTIVTDYRLCGWQSVVASSGTAKAVAEILAQNTFGGAARAGDAQPGIQRVALMRLKEHVLSLGRLDKLKLTGLREDRRLVLPGGLAILCAIFDAFDLDALDYSEGALRLGVLYDLLGRQQNDDLRTATVSQFMQRHDVDRRQAARVSQTAAQVLTQLSAGSQKSAKKAAKTALSVAAVVCAASPDEARDEKHRQFLSWAALLHEIGIAIAHAGYHRHGAYILKHADMPGFSKPDQECLARLVQGHRGKLERVTNLHDAGERDLIFALRLAVLLHRARNDARPPEFLVRRLDDGYRVDFAAGWLEKAPLTAEILDDEVAHWRSVGVELKIAHQRRAVVMPEIPHD